MLHVVQTAIFEITWQKDWILNVKSIMLSLRASSQIVCRATKGEKTEFNVPFLSAPYSRNKLRKTWNSQVSELIDTTEIHNYSPTSFVLNW